MYQLIIILLLWIPGVFSAQREMLPKHYNTLLPADAIGYLESANGTVAVVAVAGDDGSRWLHELHERGVSVMLWRKDGPALKGGLPCWLQSPRVSAYLFVGKNGSRMLEAATAETRDSCRGPRIYLNTPLDKGGAYHLKFRQWCPLVVALALTNRPASISYEKKQIYEINMVFWRYHLVNGVFTVIQRVKTDKNIPLRKSGILEPDDDGWVRYVMDVLRHRHLLRPQRLLAGLPSTTLRQILSYRERNAGGYPVDIIKGRCKEAKELQLNKDYTTIFGSNYRMLVEIANLYNLKIIESHVQVHLDTNHDNLRTKTFHALDSGHASIYLCEIAITNHHLFTRVSFLSASATFTHTLIIVPRAHELPAWSLPLRVFRPEIWAAWLASLLLYALAWRFVAKVSLTESLAAALAVFSSACGSRQERYCSLPQRLQLAGALLASAVVIINVYQGRLYTLMTEPERHAEIDTIQQLVDSEYLIKTDTLGAMILLGQPIGDHEVYKEINAITVHAKERKALLGRAEYMENTTLRMQLFSDKSKRAAFFVHEPNIYLMAGLCRECFERYRVMRYDFGTHISGLLVRRNWPWERVANTVILRAYAAGIIQWWRRHDAMYHNPPGRANSSKTLNRESELEEPGLRIFVVSDVRPHFLLITVGLAGALVVFAWELCVKQRQ